ncbi:MAG TPA: phosphoenolpyruvate--protein phosphotransferase [Thermoanaerobaculia bacterium]|jgi:phosphotransferase system enzyme I (PtsI)
MKHAVLELKGLGVSDGVAIGKAICINTRIADVLQIPLPAAELETEIERFHAAVMRTREDLYRMRDRVGRELGEDLAGIFDAQSLLLSDGTFLDRVDRRIREEHVNAEWALQETVSEIQARFDEIDTEHLRERGQDLRDVGRYVVRSLRGLHLHLLSEVSGEVVIVADDLTPSDAVRLGRENVVGFVTEHGSRTSHTTIIARSLNIPMVTGVSGIQRHLADQAEVPIIVDGSAGTVMLRPDQAALRLFRERVRDLARREVKLLESSELRGVTVDGAELHVMANVDLPEEILDAKRFGAAGVGLYRSEFLYIEKSPRLPSEEEHIAIYRQLVESAAPHPAIIRTYDLGGRKIAREVMETREENPVLGLRGIRLTLARPDIFKTQIRALMRAAVFGDLWVMLPLVTIVEEVRAFRTCVDAVAVELEREGLVFRRDFKLGIMIEVPAAALISDLLAREADFFSIGTNDLIQYALAVDRNNEHVANLYRPLHPAMLRMLRTVVINAGNAGIEVSLCGEMAADERFTPILVGLGLRRLSVAPRQVPAIKRRIRGLNASHLGKIVEICSDLATAAEVDEYLQSQLGELLFAAKVG